MSERDELVTRLRDQRDHADDWRTDKELMGAIVTVVMSANQSDRNDALRKVQRHIIRVEEERDKREAECEHLSEHRGLAEARITELEAEGARRRAFEKSMRCPQCDMLRLELGEARAALAEAQRDAARYRWLVNAGSENSPIARAQAVYHIWNGEDGTDGFTRALDAAISKE